MEIESIFDCNLLFPAGAFPSPDEFDNISKLNYYDSCILSTNLNQIVLDPFMGSGTTAIAALGLQRQAIGFEIRADYCDIAAARVDDFLINKELPEAQLSLF